MKVLLLLILAFAALTRAAIKPSNYPHQSFFERKNYQNIESSPFVSSTPSPSIINSGYISLTPESINKDGYISSTSGPIINSGYISSTPGPIVNSDYVSSTAAPSSQFGIDGGFVSSTPSPISNEIDLSGNILSTAQPDVLLNGVSSAFGGDGSISSTPFPSLLNADFDQESNLGQLLNIETNSFSNSFVQNVPQAFGGYDTVSVLSDASGGSLDDSFDSSASYPKVSKNVYFFAAPEENESVRAKVYIEPPKKNHNVIFIKAPAPAPLAPIVINPPPQPESQDKTVVYVLVKKPEEQQDIIVKAAPVVKPPKPEVVFVKYNNEDEARRAVSRAQAEHAIRVGQQSAQPLNHPEELFNIERAKNALRVRPTIDYVSDNVFKPKPNFLNVLNVANYGKPPFQAVNNLFDQSFIRQPNFQSSFVTTESPLSLTDLQSGFVSTQSPLSTIDDLQSGFVSTQSPLSTVDSLFNDENSKFGYGTSTVGNIPEFSFKSINSSPFSLSTGSPNVEINGVPSNIFNIRGRPIELSNSIATSTVSPLVQSSTFSPSSTTISPEISSLSPFNIKK